VQPVGACVPEDPLPCLINPFAHLCIMNLHTPPQVGLSIGATMAEI
jgi:hypothetical protein